METRETILQELRNLSPAVADLGKENTYSVPPTYFEQFASTVLARIQLENADFGAKSTPFGVPKGYFDDLAGNILFKIKSQREQSVEDELNEIAPFLNTISKQPVYTIPEGYFESLELTVPLKLAKPSARVFRFGSPKRILQYAVAACVAGILMVGGYLYINQQNAGSVMPISYNEATTMNVSQELANVNEQEIDQYLTENPSTGYSIYTSQPEDVDVEEYINTTSDDEINEYLNENAEPGELTKRS